MTDKKAFNFNHLELSREDFEKKYARQCYLFGFLVAQKKGEYKALKTVFTDVKDETLLKSLKEKAEYTQSFVDGYNIGELSFNPGEEFTQKESVRLLKEQLMNAHSGTLKLAILKELNLVSGVIESRPYRGK